MGIFGFIQKCLLNIFRFFWRIMPLCLWLFFSALTLGVVVGGIGYVAFNDSLPEVTSLKHSSLQVPLKVFSREGAFISEFGVQRRVPLNYEDLPQELIHAILATEDQDFFKHGGVDLHAIFRAVWSLIKTGEKRQGGSTITMQVARNFFLSRERSYVRKLREVLLAWKIEQTLSKKDILSLYANKIFLGHRSYGFGAAAEVYYGKKLNELTLPQFAMLAGLPQAPSRVNPITNPSKSLARRNLVLRRMLSEGYINENRFQQAVEASLVAIFHRPDSELHAPYVAEMVRQFVEKHYGDDAYRLGYRVYTTLSLSAQSAANSALRDALLTYDKRHGYRERELYVDLDELVESIVDIVKIALARVPVVSGLLPAVVIKVNEKEVIAMLSSGEPITISWPGLEWARSYITVDRLGPAPKKASQIVKRGDMIRVVAVDKGWQLSQVPSVSGAMVALNPNDGAILALVGGFNFQLSSFNRVSQAYRQPGSNFKPFIYSAAFDNGYTPATLINDAPVVFDDFELGASWRPENYSGKTFGLTRLREGLVHSRNLVSIRLLRALDIPPTIHYLTRFGFEPHRLPKDLALSLGSADLTPLSIVRGYSVFANGGFLVDPFFVDRIEDLQGNVVFQSEPKQICRDCPVDILSEEVDPLSSDNSVDSSEASSDVKFAPRVIEPANAYLVTHILQDVIKRGTGRRARVLKRSDLSGKTGTTNEQMDAWFSGYNSQIVATSWVGFDHPKPLGRRETGGKAALPMWIRFMQGVLDDIPETALVRPEDIVTVRIDSKSGLLARPHQQDAIFEVFQADNVPQDRPAHEAGFSDGPSMNNIEAELF